MIIETFAALEPSFLLAQVQQPTPDAGPFMPVLQKLLGVIAGVAPWITVGLIIAVGAWFGVCALDPQKDESGPKKALVWTIIGGTLGASAALIANWAWGV